MDYTLMPGPRFSGSFLGYPSLFVSTHHQVWSDARHADQPLGLEWNATLVTIGDNPSFEK